MQCEFLDRIAEIKLGNLQWFRSQIERTRTSTGQTNRIK